MYYNARSLLPKLDELKCKVVTESPDVICIVETWLSSEILDNEIAISDYQIFRRDRDRHGGGVMIYVHSCLAVDLHVCVPNIEFISISVSVSKVAPKFCIALYYRPPSASVDCFDYLSRTLCNLNPSSFNKFILVGDFNVNFFCTHSHLYSNLMYSLTPFNLIQIVKFGTHINRSSVSLLDLIFVSAASFLYSCSALPPLGNSDHIGLQLLVQVKNLKRKQGNQHILWNYNQGDFAKAKRMINATNWDQLFSTDMNISLQNWQSEFLHIMEACIPKSRPSSKRRLPWLTRRMLLLINKKNKLFRAWRQSGSLTLRRKYIALRNSLTNLLKSAKKSFFRNVNTTDQKCFWKSVHLLTSSSASVPTLVHDTGAAFTSQEKADTLSEFFAKCFNAMVSPLSFADLDTFGRSVQHCPEDFLCTVEEIEHLLESLDVSKSTGPDGISARMLKAVVHSIAPSVTRLVNQSLESGCFPVLWKMSNIVPIPKAGESTNPCNYRPISLLSILSKLLEKHVASLLADQIQNNSFISDFQWGFLPGRSTTSALLSVTNDWHKCLDSGYEICSIFLDLRKAFDSVPSPQSSSCSRTVGCSPYSNKVDL